MERIAAGFALAEAPVVRDEVLLVSDVLGGGVRRFDVDGTELAPLLDRRRGIGGMGVRPDGWIVVSGRDLSLVADDGTLTVLAPMLDGGTGYNDLTVATDGTIVVGMLTCHPMGGDDLTPGALVVVAPDGAVSSAPLEFCWPNGIGFSADGQLLLADYDSGVVHASGWTGSIEDVEFAPWATSPTGDADGLAVAADGRVWLAGGAAGVLVVCDPSGSVVDQVRVPDDFVSSCAWWPGRDRLVITTGTGIFFHDT